MALCLAVAALGGFAASAGVEPPARQVPGNGRSHAKDRHARAN